MSFRTNLQYLRAQRNMTQERLAMLLGVSRQAISKWESEKAYPEMDKLLMICDLFGCTLDDLVLGDVSVSASQPDSHGASATGCGTTVGGMTGEDAGSPAHAGNAKGSIGDADEPAPIRYEPHRSGGDANQSAGLHDAPGGVFPRQTGPARRDLLVATAQFVAVAAVVVVLVALSEKDRELFERLLGLVLVVGLGVTTTSVLRGPDRNWGLGLAGAVGALAGVGLMISPNRWLEGITLPCPRVTSSTLLK